MKNVNFFKKIGLLILLRYYVLSSVARANTLIVSAASSLTNAFNEIGLAYQAQHPHTKIIFNYGASDQLMQQIVNGAPVDVFASADQVAMNKAEKQQVIIAKTRENFIGNRLVLIVPRSSTLVINQLRDLEKPQIQTMTYGNPQSVPAGRYAENALKLSGIWQTIQPKCVLADNVRQALNYVVRGEVDAGLVFNSDAILFPNSVKVIATLPSTTAITYPIAVVKDSRQPQLAQQFIHFVMSPQGQNILIKYGFNAMNPIGQHT